jgi:hypothetical protein
VSRRRRRRIRAAAGAGGAVLVVAAGAAAAVGFGGTPEPAASRGSQPPATAAVTRQTLTRTETVDGTLGYGEATTVAARGAGGTLTWLPGVGTVLGRGQPVYKVDEQPVPLVYGSTPLYRTLRAGVEGADAKLLEQNLSALGYGGFTVDDEYTGATADAVRQWQADLGVAETGRVEVGQVVVARGQIRVTEHKTTIGMSANGPVLDYTGTTRIVTVNLDVAQQQLVRAGVAATVELPDGRRVAGTVESVGTVATVQSSGSGNQQETTTTVEVTVSVRDQKALGTLDQAPVDVVLQAERRPDVLTVPVNALVALIEGGYGVQVVDGDGTRYVAVQTGMFAGGRVEVTGAGLTEGTAVGVPK